MGGHAKLALMILGVDHLALSCADLERGCAALEAEGYSVAWRVPELPSHPAKRSYLAREVVNHGVAYARTTSGVALELTCHGPLSARRAPAQVLFGGHPFARWDHAAEERPSGAHDAAWTRALGSPPRAIWLEPFQVSGWADPTSIILGPRAVLLPCADLATEARFWVEGLGASVEPQADPTQRIVRMGSAVAAWRLTVVLALAEPEPPPLLDDAGFPCLALLSTACDEDGERAARAGGSARSEPFELDVAGRRLRLQLLRSPSGHIIELVRVQRR